MLEKKNLNIFMIDMYFIIFLEERIIISNCYKKYKILVVNILFTWF